MHGVAHRFRMPGGRCKETVDAASESEGFGGEDHVVAGDDAIFVGGV